MNQGTYKRAGYISYRDGAGAGLHCSGKR